MTRPRRAGLTLDAGPVIATDERFVLGEGPVWDPIRGQLLWVDINAGGVFAGSFGSDGRIVVTRSLFLGETTSAVAPSERGDWLIAGAKGLYIHSADGALTSGPRILPAHASRRLNDGKPDPGGRFVVGSMTLEAPSAEEQLVLVDGDRVRVIDADLTLSNGLAWSADGHTMFTVDSFQRVVFRRAWDASAGTWGPRTTHLEFDVGLPDGICLDEQDHLWVAMWGLGEVRRYAPNGVMVESVRLPAPNVSSVAFAGPELDVLVITTATHELTPDQVERFPASGALFTWKPRVRGLQQAYWAGPS